MSREILAVSWKYVGRVVLRKFGCESSGVANRVSRKVCHILEIVGLVSETHLVVSWELLLVS